MAWGVGVGGQERPRPDLTSVAWPVLSSQQPLEAFIPPLVAFSGADPRGHQTGLATAIVMNLGGPKEGTSLAVPPRFWVSPQLGRASGCDRGSKEGLAAVINP